MATVNQTMNYARPRGWLARHETLALGLWIAAIGILTQAATGATNYTKVVPPGVVILAVAGIGVYFTSRWKWSSVVGLLLAAFISLGVFVTPGTAYRLQHPNDIGPLIGTIVQLGGLLLSLIAGIAILVIPKTNRMPVKNPASGK